MTVTSSPASGGNSVEQRGEAKMPKGPDDVTLTIDGLSVDVPKGTLIIRAAEKLGIQIPRFCDHPLLDPVGACRQCLVEVSMPRPDGTVAPMPKPQASCTMTVAEGMEVHTQLSSPVADKAQHGVMELLLINHPLDCPVCDKGGECPLQNQAMSNGRARSRFTDVKRTYPKPINISSQVLLDRERCILCARCTRFSDQIAGDAFIALVERGALQQVGIYEEQPFESYFSGNTVQICPVGALTGAAYRFRSRPFDLVSTMGTCEHCASGCALRADHRRGVVLRRMASNDPAVNEEWNCDKGRWAFTYATQPDRLDLPRVRQADGSLKIVAWPEALAAVAAGLDGARTGVLTGGRVTVEDAYAYSKFARTVLGTNDIDFRARPHSAEELAFLDEHVVATGPSDLGGSAVSYADLGNAKSVLLVGFEPEEESPIVFLRLRRAARKNQAQVYAVAPFATRGTEKLFGTLIPTQPGAETDVLRDLAAAGEPGAAAAEALTDGGIILVGERLATVPGALTAAAQLAASTGARLAWIPRRAGERGALQAGAAPTLLPGGRSVTDAAARDEIARGWEVHSLPETPGRDTAGIIAAAAAGELDALIVGGVDPGDLRLEPEQVHAALTRPFVVALDLRESPVTELADVVLPVAAHAEKLGSFVDWEGRVREFNASLDTNHVSDHRALDMIASEMGHFLETATVAQVRRQMLGLGARAVRPEGSAPAAPADDTAYGTSASGDLVLATWALLLDNGRMQDGEPFLAGTARRPVLRMSPATARRLDLADGETATVALRRGSLTVPVLVTEGMLDDVVWLPTNSGAPGSTVRDLGGLAGDRVAVTKGGAA